LQKAEIKKSYQHYFKPAELVNYPEGFEHHLVDTEKKYNRVLDLLGDNSIVACDLETTGLNFEKAEIVGIGLCFEEKRAFYLPFRHKVEPEKTLPLEFLDRLNEDVFLSRQTLWYNWNYDGSVLEYSGFDIQSMDSFDVMELVWLADTNWKGINLKWAAKHFLGWDLLKFEELVDGLYDYSYLSPEDAKFYACSDPLATFCLYEFLFPYLNKECPFILKLDNEVVKTLIQVQKEDHLIDKEVPLRVGRDLDKELPILERDIFDLAKTMFEINSPAQVAEVLESLGLDTGSRTKTGQMETGARVLKRVDHPIAKKIIEFKSKASWKSSFVEPLLRCATQSDPVRFKYFNFSVPTGRFSAGKDKQSDYFAPLNIQAVLKAKSEKKYAHYVGDNQGILGWIFNNDESDRVVEVQAEKFNIRRAFAAPEGWYYVRCDYAGQELRIPANLSGERVWIDAFLSGKDIHAAVCEEVFGKVTKDLRDDTKPINFGIIYGMSHYSYAASQQIPLDEALAFFNRYRSKHPRLFAWIARVQKKAMRSGVAHTAFGRPRRLYHYFSSPDRKVKAFAKRSTTNTIIQGSAADIFRIAFVNMYKKYFSVYPDRIRFQKAVHDEINFLLRKDCVDMLDGILELFRLSRKDWPVSMEVGLDIGTSWGDLVAFQKEGDQWCPVPK